MKKILLLFFSIFLTPILIIAQDIQFCVDVSMNRDTLFFGAQDSLGNPATGSDFVIQGPIYPVGTFQINGYDSGLLEGGTPEFEEEKIGYYMSRGWFIQNPAAAEGMQSMTKQIFLIDSVYLGFQPFQIVLSGKEPAALNYPVERTIIGTTDEFMTYRGEAVQVNVGKNITDGFNTTFCFKMINLVGPVSVKTIRESNLAVIMSVFPNPATDQITIKVDNSSNPFQGQIILMDLLGRSLMEDIWFLHEKENLKTVDVSRLQPGMYLVLLRDQNNVVSSQKLIITK